MCIADAPNPDSTPHPQHGDRLVHVSIQWDGKAKRTFVDSVLVSEERVHVEPTDSLSSM